MAEAAPASSEDGHGAAARELMARSRPLHLALTLATVTLVVVLGATAYVIAREVQLALWHVHSPLLTGFATTLPSAAGAIFGGRWITRRLVRARMRSLAPEVASRHRVAAAELHEIIAALG